MMEVSSSFYVRSALLARNVSAEKDNDGGVSLMLRSERD